MYQMVLDMTDYRRYFKRKKKEIFSQQFKPEEQEKQLKQLLKQKQQSKQSIKYQILQKLIDDVDQLQSLSILTHLTAQIAYQFKQFYGFPHNPKDQMITEETKITDIFAPLSIGLTLLREMILNKPHEVNSLDDSDVLHMEEAPKLASYKSSHNQPSPLLIKKMSSSIKEKEQSNKSHIKFLTEFQQIQLLQQQNQLTFLDSFPVLIEKGFQFIYKIMPKEYKSQFLQLAIKQQSSNSNKISIDMNLESKIAIIRDVANQISEKNKGAYHRYPIKIDRNAKQAWNETINQFLSICSPSDLVLSNVNITYLNEQGADDGGLKNDWLTLLTQQVFHPNFGMFKLSSNQRNIFPNPDSFIIENHLLHFRYIGRFIAKIIISGWSFDVPFAQSFLKHILDKHIFLGDLEDIDENIYKGLCYIYEQDEITPHDDIYYTHAKSFYGQNIEIPLKQYLNDDDLKVVTSNKKQYIKDKAIYIMTTQIEKQIIEFKRGIYDLIPKWALELLTVNEIGLYLEGKPTLNVDELEQNTQYSNGYTKNEQTIIDFFTIIREWDDIMRAYLVFFFSGSYKIPLDGFKSKPLKLVRISNKAYLPVAHTCYNKIDLPDYKSINLMREKLKIAITDGIKGGFQII